MSGFFFITDASRAILKRSQKISSYSSKMLPCTWAGCDMLSAESEITVHLNSHGQEAAGMFHAPSRCTWSGCKSKAILKSPKLYEQHLKNLHIQPLICTVSKCSYKKPFRNQKDLDRHGAAIHSDVKRYECPYDSCESEIKTFARRDKWLKHIRETIHENDDFCPYHHCDAAITGAFPGFKNRKEIVDHFTKVRCFGALRSDYVNHPENRGEGYEYALGSCAQSRYRSYWRKRGLDEHLRENHGLDYVEYTQLDGVERTLEARHVDASAQYHDCTICNPMASPQENLAESSAYPSSQLR